MYMYLHYIGPNSKDVTYTEKNAIIQDQLWSNTVFGTAVFSI